MMPGFRLLHAPVSPAHVSPEVNFSAGFVHRRRCRADAGVERRSVNGFGCGGTSLVDNHLLTLTEKGEGTHVRFDWEVTADRPLLRYLTPVLRPLFRWNHNWAIARAIDGLEPYAKRTAAGGTSAPAAAPAGAGGPDAGLPDDAVPSAG